MRSELKYNLEEKSAKKMAGKGFEGNNYSKQDNLINNSHFFINFVVSILFYFILFYFILFYFILFYFILFNVIGYFI